MLYCWPDSVIKCFDAIVSDETEDMHHLQDLSGPNMKRDRRFLKNKSPSISVFVFKYKKFQ